MTQFYGVWVGRMPGIYDNWNDCKAQVDKFPKAKYSKLKASNLKDAKIEFELGFENKAQVSSNNNEVNKPIEGFLTVDGASNGLVCEFQAVWYPTKEVAFASKQFDGGTNNIAEFLGLVSACKYLKDRNLPIQIYTDSVTALAWFRNKKANTTANTTGKATEELSDLLVKAEKFLVTHDEFLKGSKILKWETKDWGEIPADYGRK